MDRLFLGNKSEFSVIWFRVLFHLWVKAEFIEYEKNL